MGRQQDTQRDMSEHTAVILEMGRHVDGQPIDDGYRAQPLDRHAGPGSSCGVTLIEKYAMETGAPMTSVEVTIAGMRSRSDPAHFHRIEMRFDFHGVGKQEAEHLVGIWRSR
jgi:uncharacterized OsmC-like protein